MKTLALPSLILMILISGCQAERPAVVAVTVWGSLHSMMQEGRTEASVELAGLLPDDTLWAVGALSELRGEVTVLAGDAYISYPSSPTTSRTESIRESNERATLLVASQIARWTRFTTNEEVQLDGLGAMVRSIATGAGMNTDEPFPFRIEGMVRELGWHVIDGSRLGSGAMSPESHRQASVVHELAQKRVQLIGFYSTNHGGVFTHMGSDIHVHCVVVGENSSGHVDRLTLPAGTVVFLPSN